MIAQELNTHTIKLTRKKGPRTAKKILKNTQFINKKKDNGIGVILIESNII